MKFNKKSRANFPKQNQYYAMSWGRPPIIKRHHTSFPFVAISDEAESKSFQISPNKISCFHGFTSLFTLQHRQSFDIDGVTYRSVDHYYQMRKIKDLLGVECEKFTDGSMHNYSVLAKELLKQNNVNRRVIDKWRVTCGVNAIQKALLEKARQSEALRDELAKTGDNIIVHTYAADDFFGTGVPFKYVKDWCTGMEEKKVVIKFPVSYPLTTETLKSVPSIGKGRNVLGAIYMILREKINAGQLNSLNVDLIPFEREDILEKKFENNEFQDNNGVNSNGGGGMDIDFTVDDDSVATSTSTTFGGNGQPTSQNGVNLSASTSTVASTTSLISTTTTAAATPKVKIPVNRFAVPVTRAAAKKATATTPTVGATNASG